MAAVYFHWNDDSRLWHPVLNVAKALKNWKKVEMTCDNVVYPTSSLSKNSRYVDKFIRRSKQYRSTRQWWRTNGWPLLQNGGSISHIKLIFKKQCGLAAKMFWCSELFKKTLGHQCFTYRLYARWSAKGELHYLQRCQIFQENCT